MSGVCSYGTASLNRKPGKKVSVVDSESVIQAHPPAILRPQRLWTGKQVGIILFMSICTIASVICFFSVFVLRPQHRITYV